MYQQSDSFLLVVVVEDVKTVETALKKVQWLDSAAKVYVPELLH